MNFVELYGSKEILSRYSQIVISNTQRKAVKDWLQLLHDNKLEKEKENYRNFSDIILRDLLNYPEKELRKGFEQENVEFSFKDKDGNTKVVFEAKGTKTKELDQRQDYGKKEQETPVIQTLTYMARIPSAFGVTTNYRKYWLLDLSVGDKKCHKFDFYDMENNDEKIREFIGIFSYEKLVLKNDKEELHTATITAEKKFTDEFYKLFHETRLMLIKTFQENSKVALTEAIYYTQLFLNRLIFIFFVEDRGFLSDNRLFTHRLLKILDSEQSTEHSKKVYSEITELFVAFDQGDKGLGVFGFNGGLFSGIFPDKISFSDQKEPNFFSDRRQHSKLLKSTKLNDNDSKIINKQKQLNPIIYNLLLMDSFNFATEVNVNILGHIFEQSISDLEELKKEGISKRKKEGVYYTPEFITDYICRNTIIPYLSKSGKTSVDDLIDEYSDSIEELENKFKKIIILDPACGSGAFLVKAIDVLLDIYTKIQDVKESSGKYSTGTQFQLTRWNEEDEISRIIESNIYGVDVNPEAVEITQLSLFLKLASTRRKLSGLLRRNIKVGNSLIDDKDVDVNAFDWNKEFPDVLDPLIKDKGFDIVIGNPPYVTTRKISKPLRDYFWTKYRSFLKDEMNLFTLFYARVDDLIKKNGIWGFITPSGWYTNNPYLKLREWFFKENKITGIVDFPYRFFPFDDVNTETAIVLGKKQYEKNNEIRILKGEKNILEKTGKIHPNLQVNIVKQDEVLTSPSYKFYIYQNKITAKLDTIEEKLGKIIDVHNPSSLDRKSRYPHTHKQYDKCVFSEKEINEDNALKKISVPCLVGDDIQRYYCIVQKKFTNLKWIHKNGKERELNSNTLSWMNQNKIVGQRITGQVSRRLIFSIDFMGMITMPSANIVLLSKPSKDETANKDILYYILGLLNSKLFNYYYEKKYGEANTNITSDPIESFPIKFSDKQKLVVKNVIQILELYQEFNEKNLKIVNRMKDNLDLKSISMKLEKFYVLDFKEFLEELRKNNIKLSLKEQDEWQNYFDENRLNLRQLHEQIEKTDSEIDSIIYEIFELNNQDIEIVEKYYL